MIFRRDHAAVQSLDGLKTILRANGYGNGDPFATDSFAAICSRGDLLENGKASMEGCYDSKATSASLFMNGMGAYVVNGPTNQNQPTFNWKLADKMLGHNATGSEQQRSGSANAVAPGLEQYRHVGQPEVFDFDYELMEPRWHEAGHDEL